MVQHIKFSRVEGAMDALNLGVTENGAPSFVSTLDHRLNLFFKAVRNVGVFPGKARPPDPPVGAKGGKDALSDDGSDSDASSEKGGRVLGNEELYTLVEDSWRVDPLDTMKILMNWRDCRGGKGDYRGFLVTMAHVAKKWPEWFLANLEVIPEYGCWLDIVKLWHLVDGEKERAAIIGLVVKQLIKDEGAKEGESVSLLAKWLPSEGYKWDTYSVGGGDAGGSGFVESVCKELFNESVCKELFNHKVGSYELRAYRKKYLVPLRKKIGLVETAMCEKKLGVVEYDKVPSVAMKKYRKAFEKRDKVRFEEYLAAVKRGEKTIKAGQVYPHDLVRVYTEGMSVKEDEVVEAQWREIKKKVDEVGAFKDSLVVCDVSGSMSGTPMEVAVALGLLGMRDRRLITFSEKPEIHLVKGETLRDQVFNVKGMKWGTSTNFDAVMDIALGMCIGADRGAGVSAIKRIFVFSDMQFDQAMRGGDAVHFAMSKAKFEKAGLAMPQIVFWNLRGDTKDFPVTCDERGVVMLSGYSPSLLEAIIDGEDVSPMSTLLKIIHGKRYDLVREPGGDEGGAAEPPHTSEKVRCAEPQA